MNGLLIQWGYNSAMSAQCTISFGINFSNTYYMAGVFPTSDSTDTSPFTFHVATIKSRAENQMICKLNRQRDGNTELNTVPITWLAIGY